MSDLGPNEWKCYFCDVVMKNNELSCTECLISKERILNAVSTMPPSKPEDEQKIAEKKVELPLSVDRKIPTLSLVAAGATVTNTSFKNISLTMFSFGN